MFVTNIGNGLQVLVMGTLLYEKTHSVLSFGLVLITEFFFKILLQFYAGSIIDRINPLYICRFADLVRGSVIVVSYFLLEKGYFYLPIILTTFVINFFKPFYITASFSIATVINSNKVLPYYNALFSVSKRMGQLIGSFLFSILVLSFKDSTIFLFNGISYFFSFILLCGSVISGEKADIKFKDLLLSTKVFKEWKDTLILVSKKDLLSSIIFASSDSLIFYFYNLMLVPMVIVWFNKSAISSIQIIFVLGTVVGSSLVRKISNLDNDINRLNIFGYCTIVQAISFISVLISKNLFITCGAIFCIGISNTLSFTLNYSKLQLIGGKNIKGKISSLYLFLVTIFSSILVVIISNLYKLNIDYCFYLIAFICLIYFVCSKIAINRIKSRNICCRHDNM